MFIAGFSYDHDKLCNFKGGFPNELGEPWVNVENREASEILFLNPYHK